MPISVLPISYIAMITYTPQRCKKYGWLVDIEHIPKEKIGIAFILKPEKKDIRESHLEYFSWELFCIETFPLDSLPNVLLVTKKGSTRSKFF